MADSMTGVRLPRGGVKRKLLQDREALPSTYKTIHLQDKLDHYNATFKLASEIEADSIAGNYIPSPEQWTVLTRNNLNPQSWYGLLTLLPPDLQVRKPWPPPPNASPDKQVVPTASETIP